MIVSRRTLLGLMPAIPGALRALVQTPPASRLRRFVTAGSICYVIETDGRVKAWTWGPDVKGVAIGLDHDRLVPHYVAQDVPALRGAVAIAAGSSSPSYAAMADGSLITWGTRAPARVSAVPAIVSVEGLGPHVLALTAEGTVIDLGADPVQVPGLSGVVAISAGWSFSLALMKDGSIRAWGDNRFGQLGDGTVENRARPVAVGGIANAVAVATREDYSAALLADGTVMTWGRGYAALGRGDDTGSPNPIPRPVPDVIGITAIAAGGAHMLAVHRTGGVVSWGFENVARPVGHPNTPSAIPAAVPLITTARAVFAGPLSSQVLLADGTFWVWGALPSLSFRVDGADPAHSRFPIPMVVNGL